MKKSILTVSVSAVVATFAIAGEGNSGAYNVPTLSKFDAPLTISTQSQGYISSFGSEFHSGFHAFAPWLGGEALDRMIDPVAELSENGIATSWKTEGMLSQRWKVVNDQLIERLHIDLPPLDENLSDAERAACLDATVYVRNDIGQFVEAGNDISVNFKDKGNKTLLKIRAFDTTGNGATFNNRDLAIELGDGINGGCFAQDDAPPTLVVDCHINEPVSETSGHKKFTVECTALDMTTQGTHELDMQSLEYHPEAWKNEVDDYGTMRRKTVAAGGSWCSLSVNDIMTCKHVISAAQVQDLCPDWNSTLNSFEFDFYANEPATTQPITIEGNDYNQPVVELRGSAHIDSVAGHPLGGATITGFYTCQ